MLLDVGSNPTASTNTTRTVEKSTVLLFIHDLYTNSVKNRQRFIFLLGIEVAICVERLLYVAVTKSATYLKNINSVISKQGCMTMTEVMYAYMVKSSVVCNAEIHF